MKSREGSKHRARQVGAKGRGLAWGVGAWALTVLPVWGQADGIIEDPPATDALPVEAQPATSETDNADTIEPNGALGPFSALQPRYHDLEEIRRLIQGWDQAGAHNVRSLLIHGTIPVLEFGGGDVQAKPLESRRVVLLVGGLDGRSVAGGEAVLHAAHKLLTRIETLRDDLSIVVVPWAAPETLALVDQGRVDLGRDLDGDGLITEMLVEDAQGPWALCEDGRFVTHARQGDAPRFRRDVEGRVDQDHRQAVTPDDLFALALDQASLATPNQGLLDANDHPVAAYLQDLVLRRPTACAVVFQGNHGGIATPGAHSVNPWDDLPDQRLFRRIGRALRSLTGEARSHVFVQTIRDAHGQEGKGSFVDWCYTVPGVLAFEVAPWGVPVVAGEHEVRAPVDPWSAAPPLDESGQAWARWLDEARGGMGFSAWRPVERGAGDTVLVGGWKPKTFHNPPADELEGALRGLDAFVEGLVEQQATLELCDVTVSREGELCTVMARVKCGGGLPLHPAAFGRWGGWGDGTASTQPASTWMQLDVPASMRLLAGPQRVPVGELHPGAKTETLRWLLMAPAGSRLPMDFGVRDVLLQRVEVNL